MKLVLEPDVAKAGAYIAKIYYFDDLLNVAKLLIDQVKVHSLPVP
jgi:hypothetical protein